MASYHVYIPSTPQQPPTIQYIGRSSPPGTPQHLPCVAPCPALLTPRKDCSTPTSVHHIPTCPVPGEPITQIQQSPCVYKAFQSDQPPICSRESDGTNPCLTNCEHYVHNSLGIGNEETARGRPFIRHPPPCAFMPFMNRRDPEEGMYSVEAFRRKTSHLRNAVIGLPETLSGVCRGQTPSWVVQHIECDQMENRPIDIQQDYYPPGQAATNIQQQYLIKQQERPQYRQFTSPPPIELSSAEQPSTPYLATPRQHTWQQRDSASLTPRQPEQQQMTNKEETIRQESNEGQWPPTHLVTIGGCNEELNSFFVTPLQPITHETEESQNQVEHTEQPNFIDRYVLTPRRNYARKTNETETGYSEYYKRAPRRYNRIQPPRPYFKAAPSQQQKWEIIRLGVPR